MGWGINFENINFDSCKILASTWLFGAYKILRSTKTVDVIPAFDELIYFLIIFAESRVEVNIC
jgi:hypothetical protein